MYTKTKTIAVLMAAIIVSAVVVPMAQTSVDTQAQVTGSEKESMC